MWFYSAACQVEGIHGIAHITDEKLEFRPDGETKSTIEVEVKSMVYFQQSKAGSGTAKLRVVFDRAGSTDGSTDTLDIDMTNEGESLRGALELRDSMRDRVFLAMDLAGKFRYFSDVDLAALV